MRNEILKVIADNPTLLQAVKEVVLKQFSFDDINPDIDDNNKAGEAFRVVARGRKNIDSAFTEISTYETPKPRTERINRAM